jgi:hypothetical protein
MHDVSLKAFETIDYFSNYDGPILSCNREYFFYSHVEPGFFLTTEQCYKIEGNFNVHLTGLSNLGQIRMLTCGTGTQPLCACYVLIMDNFITI